MQKIHYATLAGIEIVLDASEKIVAFLEQVQGLLADRKATESDVITLVYGPENPILARHPLFPERGYVTREALEHPVYPVLADLVARKHVQREKVDVSKLGDRFTLTVAQACERLKVSDTTIRKAIASGRLQTFRRNGNYFLDPANVDALKIGERGSAVSEPLEIVAGTRENLFLHVRTASQGEPFGAGTEASALTLQRWRRIGVLSGNSSGLRMFVLEPSESEESIKLGKYHVAGKFRIVKKLNNSAAARKAWKEFRAV